MNIPQFGQNVSGRGWFVRWSAGKTGHSPDTLTDEHRAEIAKIRDVNFFIRKVGNQSTRLMDSIDEMIAREKSTQVMPVAPKLDAEWRRDAVPCPRLMPSANASADANANASGNASGNASANVSANDSANASAGFGGPVIVPMDDEPW
eukprot:CAMPEP_0168422526 /NCGR_PEP_ID=MMETSP0228-20121227/33839_1 /TAXON_ID=133427 /ORGANISM="Protoceratium reticulatum, Strain CCCM 535 (=CCMP 1889)" /LENGTH=147 /DNA_ID=CAMNT_0008436461 /DNA_START=24 /DNA_END=464 /DNA_ORIENTATION=-